MLLLQIQGQLMIDVVHFWHYHKKKEAEGLGLSQTNEVVVSALHEGVRQPRNAEMQLQPGSSGRCLTPTGDGWNCWEIPWSGEPAQNTRDFSLGPAKVHPFSCHEGQEPLEDKSVLSPS